MPKYLGKYQLNYLCEFWNCGWRIFQPAIPLFSSWGSGPCV